MINFAARVLGPAMTAFGGGITVTPLKSQPGATPYPARGVYRLKPVEEQVEETGLFHRSHQHELGIRLSSFLIAPKQGDRLARTAGTAFIDGLLPDGTFEVKDVVLDGQGGADLVLQKVA